MKHDDISIPRAAGPAESEIRDWLVAHISAMVGVPPDRVDIHTPIEQYGMDSIQAMHLCGELEDWLRRPLVPTLVWDYPTVDLLVRHLSEDPHHA